MASAEDLLADAREARQNGDMAGGVRALPREEIPGYERSPKVREGWSRLYGKVRATSLILAGYYGHLKDTQKK